MTIAAAAQTVVERFMQEAELAGATVHGPLEAGDVPALVKSIVDAGGGSGVIAWSASELGVSDAWTALERLGLAVTSPNLPADKAPRATALAALDSVAAGLTSAVGALADTGTLVMASGAGRPRLAWLLPPIHVAIVPTTAVVPDMASFFADPARVSPSQAAHMAFVTGPSRTADIELTLTRGVHGPKALHIILMRT